MFPVSVSISHLPPVADFGTFISPVSVSVINTFSVSRFPVTSPVSVSISNSAASHPSKLTFPVLLSIESFSDAITFLSRISPVSPVDLKLLQVISVKLTRSVEAFISISPLHLTLLTVTVPVEVESSSVSSEAWFTPMFPAEVFIFTDSEEGEQKSTSPVLKFI